MLPAAPDVQVFAPSVLFAGREATAEIVIEAKKQTKVDAIDTRLTGYQGWNIGDDTTYSTQVELPNLQRRLMAKGVLPAGTNRFRVKFSLPSRMPPSHALTPAYARVELFVHVAIPWWPDGKYHFTLPVRVPPPSHVQREPYAIRSASAGPGAPRMELSLASRRLVAGETVVGSIALFHMAREDRKREVDITLVPQFTLYSHGRKRKRTGSTLGVTITVPPGSAGTSVPFHFKLPADITPSFAATTHDLEWWLRARTGSVFGNKVDVMMPLEIYDASAASKLERLTTAPRLSDARIEAAFDRFCDQYGWARVVDELDPNQLVVERDVDVAKLRLGYAYRDRGAVLISRVGYPLGLGLDIRPSSPVRELLSRDIEIEVAEFDRAHRVDARFADQAATFLRKAVKPLDDAAAVLGPLARWTDDEIVFEKSIVAVGPTELEAAAKFLDALARVIALTPVPPPPTVDIDLDDYRKLATRLAGRLTVGDLSITGKLDQVPVDIAVEWDDDNHPRMVRVYVGDPDHVAFALDGETHDGAQLEWPLDVVETQVVEGVATGAVIVRGDRVDVSRVRELVFALRAWLERLRSPAGPYR